MEESSTGNRARRGPLGWNLRRNHRGGFGNSASGRHDRCAGARVFARVYRRWISRARGFGPATVHHHIELEVGTADVGGYAAREGKSAIHRGVSIGHIGAHEGHKRSRRFSAFWLRGPWEPATPDQLTRRVWRSSRCSMWPRSSALCQVHLRGGSTGSTSSRSRPGRRCM
jgi:hypothetical protein